MGTRTIMEARTISFCDDCGEEKGKEKSLRPCIKCGRDLCEEHRLDITAKVATQQYYGFSICYSCMPAGLLSKEVYDYHTKELTDAKSKTAR